MDKVLASLRENSYPGRGILAGFSPNRQAVLAYFIMGRSENSRNRIFRESDNGLNIALWDPTKVKDTTLILYPPVRVCGASIFVTNGDQTNTILDALGSGGSFRSALDTRCFEPDEPNYTPRISACLHQDGCQMSILRRAGVDGSCLRMYWNYTATPGVAHLIHTYAHDGNPLPPFVGAPKAVKLPDTPEELTEDLWQVLNTDNKVSLYVRYTNLADSTFSSCLRNVHAGDMPCSN